MDTREHRSSQQGSNSPTYSRSHVCFEATQVTAQKVSTESFESSLTFPFKSYLASLNFTTKKFSNSSLNFDKCTPFTTTHRHTLNQTRQNQYMLSIIYKQVWGFRWYFLDKWFSN